MTKLLNKCDDANVEVSFLKTMNNSDSFCFPEIMDETNAFLADIVFKSFLSVL